MKSSTYFIDKEIEAYRDEITIPGLQSRQVASIQELNSDLHKIKFQINFLGDMSGIRPKWYQCSFSLGVKGHISSQ